MIAVLEHFIRKDHEDLPSAKVTQRYASVCSVLSIFLNLLLFGGKLLASTISRSVGIAADAFNNLADAGTCIAELLGFTVAGFGAGENHPFGHGRIEWLMGLFSAIVVLYMGVEMAKVSLMAIRSPEPLTFHLWTLVILAVSIAVKFYMYLYNKKIGTKISSVAMKAKAYDCLGDLAATTSVLLSSIAIHVWGWKIDGWCGLAVSAFILYAGVQALKETAGPLMGSAPDHELSEIVRRICLDYPQISGVYELMEHDYGFQRKMISFHIGGDYNKNAKDLVMVSTELSRRLFFETGCSAAVQVELLVPDEEKISRINDDVKSAVKKIHPEIVLRDVRLVQQADSVIVIMDVIVCGELIKQEDKIKEAITITVHEVDSNYLLDIKVKMSASTKHRTINNK